MAAGLKFVVFGLAAQVASFAIMLTGVVMAATPPLNENDLAALPAIVAQKYPQLLMAALGFQVLARVLGVTGKYFCLSTPAPALAAPPIAASLVCDGASLLLFILSRAGGIGAEGTEMAMLSEVLLFVGFLSFLRYQFRLAIYLASARLTRWARWTQVGTMAVLAVWLLNVSVGGSTPLALAGVFGLIALFVVFTRLVVALRATAASAADFMAEQDPD